MIPPPPYAPRSESHPHEPLRDPKLPSLEEIETVIASEAERWSSRLREVSIQIHGQSLLFPDLALICTARKLTSPLLSRSSRAGLQRGVSVSALFVELERFSSLPHVAPPPLRLPSSLLVPLRSISTQVRSQSTHYLPHQARLRCHSSLHPQNGVQSLVHLSHGQVRPAVEGSKLVEEDSWEVEGNRAWRG